ncbi:bifunctional oligoribonuclease/PAP phosphatase NrnA [Patescibacteria group bacterium]
MSENQLHKQIVELLKNSEKILILPSAPPDGDSIGSALALFHVLKKMGKEATVVCSDPVPEVLDFLPTTNVIDDQLATSNDFIVTLDCSKAKIDTIKTDVEDNKVNIIITPKQGSIGEKEVSFNYGPSKYDLIVTVDTGDLEQLGKLYEHNAGLFTQLPVINIDHHVSNTQFGKINYVDIMASSTTEMLVPIIEDLGEDLIDEDVATLLLAGIITDTGSFQNANTSPKAFASAAHLLSYGARQQEIIQHVYKTKNLTMLKLWGRVLTKIQFDPLYRIVWSTISQQDFTQTNSNPDETGDIIDELMTNAPGADVVMLIKERGDGLISCSLRTTSQSIDASAIAEKFDGGGHVQAAGFKVKSTDLEATEKKIIQKVREYQAKRLNIHPDEEPQVISGPELEQIQKKLKDPVWKTEAKAEVSGATKGSGAKSKKPKKSTAKKVKKDDVVENIPKSQHDIDLEPGMTYKFED